jgi:phosphotransferase system IIB component
VADQAAVDAEALKRLGARGMVKPSANALQVVVGTNADQVAGEMKVALRSGAGRDASVRAPGAPATATAAALNAAVGLASAATGATSAAMGATNAAIGATSAAAGTTSAAAGTTSAATGTTSAAAGATSAAAGATSAAAGATNANTGAAGPAPTGAAAPIPTPTLTSLLAALGGRSNVRAVESASSRLRINIADASMVDQRAIAALGLRGVALAAPNWLHVIIGPEASAAGVSLRQLLS